MFGIEAFKLCHAHLHDIEFKMKVGVKILAINNFGLQESCFYKINE